MPTTQSKRTTQRATKKPTSDQPLTFQAMWTQLRKVFNLQLNNSLIQFLQTTDEESIIEMLPENMGDLDKWLDDKMVEYFENETPSTEDMIDATTTTFMTAFMERVLDHLDLETEEIDDDDDGDDSEVEHGA